GSARARPAAPRSRQQQWAPHANTTPPKGYTQPPPPPARPPRRGMGEPPRDDPPQHNRRADGAAGDHHSAAHRGGQEVAQRGRCPPQSRVQRRSGIFRAQDGRLARPIDGGIRSAEIRCRKTQYVHAWYTTVSGTMNAVTQVMILRV